MHACVRVCGDLSAPSHVCVNVARVSVRFGRVYARARERVCFGSGLASRMRRLVVSLCVQGRWCERAVRVVLPSGERV